MDNKSDKKRLTVGFITLIINGFVIIAVLVVLLNLVYGWLASNHQTTASEMDNSLKASNYPVINAWRFDLLDEESGEAYDKSGSYVNAIDQLDQNAAAKRAITPVENNSYSQGETGEAFTFRSIHLGTIDNLISLSNDNYFYIRIDVEHPEGMYENPKISYSLINDGVKFFDLKGNNQTGNLTAEQKQALVDIMTVDYAVSTAKYNPISNLSDVEALFTTPQTLQNGANKFSLGERNEPYYIYLRLSPDVNKCFEATSELSTYMPCEILYDLQIELSF